MPGPEFVEWLLHVTVTVDGARVTAVLRSGVVCEEVH